MRPAMSRYAGWVSVLNLAVVESALCADVEPQARRDIKFGHDRAAQGQRAAGPDTGFCPAFARLTDTLQSVSLAGVSHLPDPQAGPGIAAEPETK